MGKTHSVITYFNKELTIKFFECSTKEFWIVLNNSILPEYRNKFAEYNLCGIADGLDKISISKRSPFNMALYFFPRRSYMDK